MTAHFDHAAATPLDPRVSAVARRFLGESFATPSGVHEAARGPYEAIEEARIDLAALIGAAPEEIIFTSGATEARNLAVKGLVAAHPGASGVVATAVEHPATLAAARTVTRDAGGPALVAVDGDARFDPEAVARQAGPDTAVVAVHHGQADIGTLQDVGGTVARVRERAPEARIVVDAGATTGLVPVDVRAFGADAVVVGGASLGAPPWTGALWIRPGARLHPLIEGGVQEWGKRGGDPVMPGVVALGIAARLADGKVSARGARANAVGTRLAELLLGEPGVRLNGPADGRVPGYVHVAVDGVEGESLAVTLSARGVAVSPGSPCSEHAGKESPTLLAMGLTAPLTLSSVLFSGSWTTTDREIEVAAMAFAEAVGRLRDLSPIDP